jgi:methylmalonyl-CoA mutase cobalamin-binding subunit
VDFIFMLTRDDQTVEDCLEVVELIKPAGLQHIGFKDVGVDVPTLRELARRIRSAGATVYMEVVSTSREAEFASAEAAAAIGVDCLLGGTAVGDILQRLAGTGIRYYPFPGRPAGHPTKLGGSPADVADDCRRFLAAGCAGVDLLAYRATEAEPLALVRAAHRALGPGRLVVAGSINGPGRIRDLAEAGADAFTIGSAVFDGSYAPRKGGILGQLRDVLAATPS